MTILVTGATGNIGRRVVDHLITLGAKDIRALAAVEYTIRDGKVIYRSSR